MEVNCHVILHFLSNVVICFYILLLNLLLKPKPVVACAKYGKEFHEQFHDRSMMEVNEIKNIMTNYLLC